MRGKYIVDTDVQCMCVMALRHLVVALCVCVLLCCRVSSVELSYCTSTCL